MDGFRKKPIRFLEICFFYLILIHVSVQAQASELVISNGSIEVRFNTVSNTIEIADPEIGTVLYNGAVIDSGGHISTDDKSLPVTAEVNSVNNELIISAGGKVNVRAKCGQAHLVTITAQAADGAALYFRGSAAFDSGIPAITQKCRTSDSNVIFTTSGPAQMDSDALFDTSHDSLVTAESSAGAHWKWDNGWQLQTDVSGNELTVSIQINPHYYRDELGIGYFEPFKKTSFWQRAPVVALTWWGINNYGGDNKQKKEWLYPQIDYVAKNLLPYAGTMVFQLDDNYDFSDDKYMREISDYIRSKGIIPGIWFTPFSIAPRSLAKSHPDWFVHDKNGKFLTSFGGCNWGYQDGAQPYVLNVNNAQAVSQWYEMFWRKVSTTWNYEYFKLDAALNAFDAYNTSVEGGGPYGYRKGLQIARNVIGPNKFINNCSPGPITAAIGLIQGSRTGLDSAASDHAMDVIQRWNFVNNILFWCDPDAISNAYQRTTELMHFNVAARALTGQQFLTDDMWTRMPAPALKAMQKGIPVLDIRPANLYRIENWRDYDTFDLKVAKAWGSWDVAGLFNYSGSALTKVLDLSRLRLSCENVHVFEFWSSKYLGRFDRNAKLPRYMMPYDAEVFAIVPASSDKPTLLSTSRHVSQGAIDLSDVKCSGDENRWIVCGVSENLVADDNYELVFAGLNYRADKVKSDVNNTVISENGIIRVSFVPKSSCLNWQIEFSRIHEPALLLTPQLTRLTPGGQALFELTNLDANAADWQISSSDSRIHVSPVSGKLAAWPAVAKLTASVDSNGFDEPGRFEVVLTIRGDSSVNSKCQSNIIIPVLPTNLAKCATVRVSSCQIGFDPNFAVDSDSHTAWCGTVKDKNGAWIELAWNNPITISRVVLDEYTAQFTQIQEWHLEIEQDKSMKTIKSGTFINRHRPVQLDQACQTHRIRFVIDQAVNMPGLLEFELF